MSSEAWWAKLKLDAWKTLVFTLPFSWTLIITNRLCHKMPVIFFLSRTGWVTGTIMTTLVEIRQGLNFTTLSAIIKEQRMLFDALPGWLWLKWRDSTFILVAMTEGEEGRKTSLHVVLLRPVTHTTVEENLLRGLYILVLISIAVDIWLRKCDVWCPRAGCQKHNHLGYVLQEAASGLDCRWVKRA